MEVKIIIKSFIKRALLFSLIVTVFIILFRLQGFCDDEIEYENVLLETSLLGSVNGLGTAMTARINGDGMLLNPASIAETAEKTLSASYLRGAFSDSYLHLAYVHDLGKAKEKNIGFTFSSYNSGPSDLIPTSGPEDAATAEKGYMLTGTYCSSMFSWLLIRKISFGATLRYISVSFLESYTQGSILADLGLNCELYKKTIMGVNYRRSLSGAKTFYKDEIKYPVDIRAGLWMQRKKYGLGLDFIDLKKPVLGFEYYLKGSLTLRAGYRSGSDMQNLSAGFGYKYNIYDFDYSFGSLGGLGYKHLLTVKRRFK